ncbi:MAG: hypothetical protein J6Y02_02740 [Pseudobutyrivibrio sp.]|nr:hypothetical protein [Pseudobutyrivibrio sp.]
MLLLNMNMHFAQTSNRAKNMAGSNYGGYQNLSVLTWNNSTCHYGGTSSGAFHVIVGAGTTPPTKEDYDMADLSIVGNDLLRPILQTATYSHANNGAVVTTSWRNDSAAPITVTEVGLAFKYNNGVYDKASNVLDARKVLETPVTIQPGETYVFSYNLKF